MYVQFTFNIMGNWETHINDDKSKSNQSEIFMIATKPFIPYIWIKGPK